MRYKTSMLLLLPLALSACAWNPFQPSPGSASFKMSQDGVISYEVNGRDSDSTIAKFTFPNGAKGDIRIVGSRGSASAEQATAAQAQLNALLIAMLGEKIPNFAKVLQATTVVPAGP